MSAQFYKRFVPPNEQPAKQSQVPAKSKKALAERHIPSVGEAGAAAAAAASPADEYDSEQREIKSLPRREKKKRKRVESPGDEPDETDGFQKHRRLKQKYDKAPIKAGDEVEEARVQQRADAPSDSEAPKISKKHGLEPLPQPPAASEQPVVEKLPVPPWMAEPITVPKVSSEPIESLPISDEILENLKKQGLKHAMPIQETVIPLFFPKKGSKHRNRGDICVSAPTGSGKTLSYAIPMIEALKRMPTGRLRGLVIVPTRELVHQVKETLDLCADGSGLKIGTSLKNRTLAQERELLLERRIKYDPQGWEERERKAFRPTVEDLLDERDSDSEGEYDVPPGYVAMPASAVDILVCTPGRLVDHVRSTAGFTLHQVSWLVIDEADKLLDQTFQQWASVVKKELEWLPEQPVKVRILRHFLHFPQERRVQKIILSASMTRDIGKLLAIGLWRPRLVEAQSKDYELPTGLSEVAVTLGPDSNKLLVLSVLLEEILNQKQPSRLQKETVVSRNGVMDDGSDDEDNFTSSDSSSDSNSESSSDSEPDSDGSTSSSDSEPDAEPGPFRAKIRPEASRLQGILVFANSNEEALRLGRFLCLLKPQLAKRIATLSQATKSADMKRILESFRSGKLSILVATDRAARGLDVENLKAVVNYDIPTSLTDYVHRAGRTARAGREGTVYSIVQHHEGRWFWNEIGKSDQVERAAKVTRRKDLEKAVDDEARAAYEKAHDSLGDEVKGTV